MLVVKVYVMFSAGIGLRMACRGALRYTGVTKVQAFCEFSNVIVPRGTYYFL